MGQIILGKKVLCCDNRQCDGRNNNEIHRETDRRVEKEDNLSRLLRFLVRMLAAVPFRQHVISPLLGLNQTIAFKCCL